MTPARDSGQTIVCAATNSRLDLDGSGGALPDQTATVNDKPISFSKSPAVPMFTSVTDGKSKALHGWVDIDKVPNNKYNPDGSRKP